MKNVSQKILKIHIEKNLKKKRKQHQHSKNKHIKKINLKQVHFTGRT